jgi:hypothetical protein
MVRFMKSSFWSALIAVVACASIACTGAADDGTEENQPELTPNAVAANGGEEATEGDEEGRGDAPFAPAARAEEQAEEAPAGAPASALLVVEAARQVAAMKLTAYEHTTFIDEASGTYKYDCSGFLGYALSRALPVQFAAVRSFGVVERPLAKHYETFFASIEPGAKKGGWSRVARAIDVQPGDVVAWLKPADLVSSNTGHVMIATGPATLNPKRADEIIVPITDSSASFHGPADSRYPSATGLGRGAIGILVDGDGAPLGYRWTGGMSAKEYATAIAIGRPE